MSKLFRDLKCKLTPDEWAAIAASHANEQEKLEQLEAQKKSESSAIKSRIDETEKKLSDLAAKVRTHEEIRAVECFERPDDRRYIVELFRSDTGELIETRPMTSAERFAVQNPKLPGVEAAQKRDGQDEVEDDDGEDDDERPPTAPPTKKKLSGSAYRKLRAERDRAGA